MRIVFAGSPEVALPSLSALVAAGHDVVGVITRPDAPTGRGKKLTATPVAKLADELGIKVLKPVNVSTTEFIDQLSDLAPQIIPVVAYGNLIGQKALSLPEFGWVNLHFSLLPRWRGAAPVQRAIMNGDKETGACVFQLVKELDAGPIYKTISCPILACDTAGSLLEKLSHIGAKLLVEALADIENGASAHPQSTSGVTYAPKLSVAQTEIDWTKSHTEIDQLVRGANPDPGAWTMFEGKRFKVHEVRLGDYAEITLMPGQIHATKKKLFVGTGDHPLELVNVQAFSKKPMFGPDWARGANLTRQASFTSSSR